MARKCGPPRYKRRLSVNTKEFLAFSRIGQVLSGWLAVQQSSEAAEQRRRIAGHDKLFALYSEAKLPHDKALCRLTMRRTVANLKHWSVKRGLIRSMPGPGQEYVWEIVR